MSRVSLFTNQPLTVHNTYVGHVRYIMESASDSTPGTYSEIYPANLPEILLLRSTLDMLVPISWNQQIRHVLLFMVHDAFLILGHLRCL